MNWDSFPGDSRIWIYYSKDPFSEGEQEEAAKLLNQFCNDWTAHNQALFATARIFYDRFLVLMVDESKAGASGCSIDKSVSFVKMLGQKYRKDLFNRMIFSYIDGDKVFSLDQKEFKEAFASNLINDDTKVFDHLVATKKDFDTNWMKPLKESWHKRLV